jgi:hypothetical protein
MLDVINAETRYDEFRVATCRNGVSLILVSLCRIPLILSADSPNSVSDSMLTVTYAEYRNSKRHYAERCNIS